MVYASPAPGIYVLNGALPESDYPVVNPILIVRNGLLLLAVQSEDYVWRYDEESDTVVTQYCSGIDAGGATEVIVRDYEINLQHSAQEPIQSVTKADVIGRVG